MNTSIGDEEIKRTVRLSQHSLYITIHNGCKQQQRTSCGRTTSSATGSSPVSSTRGSSSVSSATGSNPVSSATASSSCRGSSVATSSTSSSRGRSSRPNGSDNDPVRRVRCERLGRHRNEMDQMAVQDRKIHASSENHNK